MTWADVQNEKMNQAGNPQKVVRIGMLVMSAVQINTDWKNEAELTNIIIALDKVKAEIGNAQKKLKNYRNG